MTDVQKTATLIGSTIFYTLDISLASDATRQAGSIIGTIQLDDLLTPANAGDILSGSLNVSLNGLNIQGATPSINNQTSFTMIFEETVAGAG